MKNHYLWIFLFVLSLQACDQVIESKSILSESPYKLLSDSIQKFPENSDLRFRRAILLSQNNHHELAYDDYSIAWEKSPTEAIAMEFVSNLFLVNKPEEAVQILETSSQKFPQNPEFKRRLSEAYAENGLTSDALKQYDEMLRQDSSDFEAWYQKAMLLLKMDDTVGAINALSRSYALQPINMNGIALANLYAEAKDSRAVDIADALIQRDSGNNPEAISVEPYFVKGIYYSNTRNFKPAIDHFDSCIRKDWKFIDAYIEKGIALFELRNIDEALQTFKRAGSVAPRNPDAYYWQGRCYEEIGKKEDAIENYRRAYSLDRSFKEAKQHLESLQKEKG